MTRLCDNCNKEYNADERNIKRGWGLCCSKSCAASKREKNKPGYNPNRVYLNNIKRENRITGHTSEGYEIRNGVAYDEWGYPVYDVSLGEYDPGDDEYYNGKNYED